MLSKFFLSLSGHQCPVVDHTSCIKKEDTLLNRLDTIQSKLDKSEDNVQRLADKLAYKPKLKLNWSHFKQEMVMYDYDGKGEKPINTYLIGDYKVEYITFLDEFIETAPWRSCGDMVFKFMTWFRTLPYKYKSERREHFEKPDEALRKLHYNVGQDCFTGDTKILVKHISTNVLREISFNELKNSYWEYLALSYNTITNEPEYKPITNFMSKGVKEVHLNKTHFGTSFESTNNHRFLTPSGDYIQVKNTGKELHWKPNKQLVSVLKTTHNGTDEISDAIANLIGSYVADGWFHNRIGGDNTSRQEILRNHLVELGVNFTQSKRTLHASTNINKTDTPDFIFELLEQCGNVGLDKQFPDWIWNLNLKSINKILFYYSQRDGTHKNGEVVEYSTISDKLSAQIKQILMLNGTHFAHRIQNQNRPDANRKPIHRINVSSKGKHKTKTTEVNYITSSVPNGYKPVYDITVEDNHNFVLVNSKLVAHNCDGWTSVQFTSLYYLIMKFYPRRINDLWAVVVNPVGGGKHILCAWIKSNRICVALETTYFRHSWLKSMVYDIHINDNMLYDSIDYFFNRKHCLTMIPKPILE